jgi:signal transduction histidine kinase
VNASRQTIPPPETARKLDADFAGLGREIATRLADLESAHERSPLDAAALRSRVSELRALLDQQSSARDELASLTDFLQTRNEREKAALSRELHDALGGILTPAKMDVAWLEERLADDPQYGARVRRLSALIDQGIDLKRRIIEALRPSLLDHLGLASALQWYVDETCRNHQLACDVHIAEEIGRFTPDLEIALYRLVQDCLLNTVRHAKARRFELTLHRTAEGLHLEIADDGVGIDDLDKARGHSHGLANMMHRVRSVHGTFTLDSAPGRGTRILVFVPVD